MQDPLGISEYAKEVHVPPELLREVLKYLDVQPVRSVGRAKLFPKELFDRIIQKIGELSTQS